MLTVCLAAQENKASSQVSTTALLLFGFLETIPFFFFFFPWSPKQDKHEIQSLFLVCYLFFFLSFLCNQTFGDFPNKKSYNYKIILFLN